MATLSEDTPLKFEVNEDPVFNNLPVIASDIIYQGAAVGDDANGYAQPLVAGDPFIGFADKQADNSSGSAGDINVSVRQKGSVELAVTGASSVADIGEPVYASDDATFTLTGGANTFIGIVTRWVSGTTCIVHYAAKSLANKPIKNLQAHTADDTLTVEESGKVHTNTGAAGAITLSLPVATVGLEYFFGVGVAQELRIDANLNETISLPSTGVPSAAGKYITANAIGETVHLLCCVAGNWSVMGFTGTWTAQA